MLTQESQTKAHRREWGRSGGQPKVTKKNIFFYQLSQIGLYFRKCPFLKQLLKNDTDNNKCFPDCILVIPLSTEYLASSITLLVGFSFFLLILCILCRKRFLKSGPRVCLFHRFNYNSVENLTPVCIHVMTSTRYDLL